MKGIPRFLSDLRPAIVHLIIALATTIIFATTDGHPHEKSNNVHRSQRSSSTVLKDRSGPVPSCDNLTFCTDIPYYPSDYVNTLLSLNETLKYLATVDVPSIITDRMNDDNEQPLCNSREEVVRPKTAQSIDDRWLYIVNSHSYVQAVRVEICQSRDTSCSMIDGFAEGYRAICRQTYVYRQMLAIGSGGTIVAELFKMPATCKCFVKFTGDPWMRFGHGRAGKVRKPGLGVRNTTKDGFNANDHNDRGR